jgi:hypothetical protein
VPGGKGGKGGQGELGKLGRDEATEVAHTVASGLHAPIRWPADPAPPTGKTRQETRATATG